MAQDPVATEKNDERRTKPPHIPFKTVANFLERLKVGVPGRIDASLMGTLSGTARSHLVSTLRYLGLISEKNVTSDALRQLVAAEGAERERIWREVLTAAYPFLFGDRFDLATATVRQLDEQFADLGASGETVRKCSAFFTAAAKAGGVALSPYIAEVKKGSGVPPVSLGEMGNARTRRLGRCRLKSGIEDVQQHQHAHSTAKTTPYQVLCDLLDPVQMSEDEQNAVWILMRYIKKQEKEEIE